MIETALQNRSEQWTGRVATDAEVERLSSRLGQLVPEWLLSVSQNYPLIGSTFSLPDTDIHFQWLEPDEIIATAFEAYPGVLAYLRGYLPIGRDLSGSGDDYYLPVHEGADPPLLRIPGEAVANEVQLLEDEIVEIYPSLSGFLGVVEVG
ncbi:hypothetical protein EON80_07320 [bacterium]|nr:MAG: hypothetical protein EON80_07320 [bacterium]